MHIWTQVTECITKLISYVSVYCQTKWTSTQIVTIWFLALTCSSCNGYWFFFLWLYLLLLFPLIPSSLNSYNFISFHQIFMNHFFNISVNLGCLCCSLFLVFPKIGFEAFCFVPTLIAKLVTFHIHFLFYCFFKLTRLNV